MPRVSVGGQAKGIGDQLRKQVAKAVTMLVLEIDANLRETTPVDTGHARANWVPSIGEPNASEVATGDGAHDSGLAQLVSYKLGDGPAFESNNAPYIQRLNAGSSTQAPALFIEAAVDKAVATVSQRYASTQIKIDG